MKTKVTAWLNGIGTAALLVGIAYLYWYWMLTPGWPWEWWTR